MVMMGMPRNTEFSEDGKMKQEGLTDAKYDENGYLQEATMSVMGQEVETPFTDYKFDDKGNWISRKTSMMGQEMEMTRTITYFE